MRHRTELAVAGLGLIALLGTGCALIHTRREVRHGPPPPYNATLGDVAHAIMMPGASPLFAVDGVVSVVADTVMLPCDSYQRSRYRADSRFWNAFFADEEPLATTEEMRDHETKYMAHVIAEMLQCELRAVDRSSLAQPGQSPPQQRILEIRQRRRSAHLARLIAAKVALAEVGAQPDLSPAQVSQLMPHARRRDDVRFALLANPATPPGTIEELVQAAPPGGWPPTASSGPI